MEITMNMEEGMKESKPLFKANIAPEVGARFASVDEELYYDCLLDGSEGGSWYNLISSRNPNNPDSRKSFGQIGTFGENLRFLHAAAANSDNEYMDFKSRCDRSIAYGVAASLVNRKITGNTAIYGGNKGSELIFVEDIPPIINGRIIMDQKSLEDKLGWRQVAQVINRWNTDAVIDKKSAEYIHGYRQVGSVLFGNFSSESFGNNTKSKYSYPVRAMPLNSLPEGGSNDWAKIKDYLIFITGDEDAPRKVRDMSSKYGTDVISFGSPLIPNGDILVPYITVSKSGLMLGYVEESRTGLYSFPAPTLIKK
jgi:hypothetical protein